MNPDDFDPDDTGTGLARLGAAQHDILDCLAEADGAVDIPHICDDRGLGNSTVREGLLSLERRGLVRVDYVRERQGTISPTALWTLTEGGKRALYDLWEMGRAPGVAAGLVARDAALRANRREEAILGYLDWRTSPESFCRDPDRRVIMGIADSIRRGEHRKLRGVNRG